MALRFVGRPSTLKKTELLLFPLLRKILISPDSLRPLTFDWQRGHLDDHLHLGQR